MQKFLEQIVEEARALTGQGLVANYIPKLAEENPNNVGAYIVMSEGKEYFAGDYNQRFTMQSISKVLSLMLALMDNGDAKIFEKVGMEPTGDSFNSIVNLELKDVHKPFNPMINAGAIVTTSMIKGKTEKEKMARILDLTRKLSGNKDIKINEDVYTSEKITGNRNRSLAYFMKSYNLIDGDVEDVLNVYFKQCSMEVSSKDIANIGMVLANDGVIPKTGERLVEKHICRVIKTLMITCGLYDASGEFAVHIGIPAKSGVGGGIMAAVPKKMGIGVYGPSLDQKGNSVAGTYIMSRLSKEWDLNIF